MPSIEELKKRRAGEALIDGEQSQSLRESLTFGMSRDPDGYAEVLDLSVDYGLPPSVIEADPEGFRLDLRMRAIDPDHLGKTAPVTAKTLSDPDTAAVAHDDTENLWWHERVWGELSQRYQRGKDIVELGNLGRKAALGSATESESLRIRALQDREMQNYGLEVEEAGAVGNFVLDIPFAVAEMAPMAFDSIKHRLAGGAGGAAVGAGVAGPAGAATGLAVGQAAGGFVSAFDTEFGNAFLELRDVEGANDDMARGVAVAVGTVNGVLEGTGMGLILRQFPGGRKLLGELTKGKIVELTREPVLKGAYTRAGEVIARGGLTEFTTESAQELSLILGILYELEKGDAKPSENAAYFEKFHRGVMEGGRELREGDQVTTMRIGSVGIDGKTYLIPFYDPETKRVMTDAEAVEKALPDIRSGALKPYDSPEEAETDRQRFYGAIVSGKESSALERFTYTAEDGTTLSGVPAIIARVLEAGIEGAKGGAGMSAVGQAANKAGRAIDQATGEAFTKGMAKLAEKSKLRERSPEKYRGFVREGMEADGSPLPQKVTVRKEGVRRFFQPDEAEDGATPAPDAEGGQGSVEAAYEALSAALKAYPELRQEIEQSLAMGTDLEVPYDVWMAYLSGTDFEAAVLPDSTFFEGIPTPNELAEIGREAEQASLPDMAEAAAGAKSEQSAANAVYQHFLEQFAKGYGPGQAEMVAQFALQGTIRQAKLRGMTLAEWVAQEGLLRVETDVPTDQVMPTLDERGQRARYKKIVGNLRAGKKPEPTRKTPILDTLSIAGVDPDSKLGREMLNVIPRTGPGFRPGLFTRKGKRMIGPDGKRGEGRHTPYRDIDNWVADEHEEIAAVVGTDESGYLDRVQMLNELENELRGMSRSVDVEEVIRVDAERQEQEGVSAAMEEMGLAFDKVTDEEIVERLMERDAGIRSDPESAKSDAKAGKRVFNQPNAAPIFYSHMLRFAEAKLPGKGKAADIAKLLETWVKKGDIKAIEFESSGIAEVLGVMGDDVVTKKQVLDLIEKGSVKLSTKVFGYSPGSANLLDEYETLGERESSLTGEFSDYGDSIFSRLVQDHGYERNRANSMIYEIGRTWDRVPVGDEVVLGEGLTPNFIEEIRSLGDEDLDALLNDMIAIRDALIRTRNRRREIEALTDDPEFSRPLFEQYITPGENKHYRETLIKLPVGTPKMPDTSAWRAKKLNQFPYSPAGRFAYHVEKPASNGSWDYVGEVVANSEEEAIDAVARNYAMEQNIQSAFRGGHWEDQDNTIAHYRADIRQGVDMEGDIFFVEELQSDWQNEKSKAEKTSDPLSVPDHPFPSNWRLIAFKHALRAAVDEGAAFIGITTGKQQSERYNLTRNVIALEFTYSAERDLYFLKGWSAESGRRSVNQQMKSESELFDYVNPEVAKQLIALNDQRAELKNAYRIVDGADDILAAVGHILSEDDKNFLSGMTDHYSGDVAIVVKPDGSILQFPDSGRGTRFFVGSQYEDFAFRAIEIDVDSQSGDRFELTGEGLSAGLQHLNKLYDDIIPNEIGKYVKKFGASVSEAEIVTETEWVDVLKPVGREIKARDVQEMMTSYEGNRWRYSASEKIFQLMVLERISFQDAISRVDVEFDQIMADRLEQVAPGVKFQSARRQIQHKEEIRVVRITDAMREQIPKGQSLFSKGRAAIEVDENVRNVVIRLGEASDLSSAMHELWHLFTLQMERDAVKMDAPQELVDMWLDLREWLGKNAIDPLTEDDYEKLAKGGEMYLREGKAPSLKLQSVFDTFFSWLVEVYRRVRHKDYFNDINLNDKVRDVFDRMLASQEEIDEARAARGIGIFPDGVLGELMTPEQLEKFEASINEARDEERRSVQRAIMAEEARQRGAEWLENQASVAQEMADEVDSDPVYKALHWLAKGKFRPGYEIEGLEGVEHARLSKAAVASLFGDEVLKMLPRPGGKPITQRIGGWHPNQLAELFGFADGREMMNRISQASPRDEEIKRRTKAAMEDRYGAFPDAAALADEAVRAVLNRKEIELLIDEEAAYSRKTKQNTTTHQVVKEIARSVVGRMKMRDARPDLFRRAAAQAAKEKLKHAKAGDFGRAQLAVREQIFALAVEAELRVRQKEMNDGFDYLKAIQGKKRSMAIIKAGGVKVIDPATGAIKPSIPYWERIVSLLERYELRNVSVRRMDKRQTMQQFIEAMDAAGESTVITDKMRNEADAQNYKLMTFDEFEGLVAAVQNIEHLAKRKLAYVVGSEHRQFEKVVEELDKELLANITPHEIQEIRAKGIAQTAWSSAMTMATYLDKIEFIVDIMDGHKPDGVWRKHVWRPLREASSKRNEWNDAYTINLGAMLDALMVGKAEEYRTSKAFPELAARDKTGHFTKMGLLAIALNLGNLGNMERLLRGERWTEAAVMSVLNRELSDADWKFIQEVWDLIDTLWPYIVEQERRLTGVIPKRVERRTFTTASGIKMSGGYFPIAYDRERGFRARTKIAGELYDDESVVGRPMTGHRWINTRTQSGIDNPLVLDIGIVMAHIDRVILDLTHREVLLRVDRIIQDERIQESLQKTIGSNRARLFRPWLQRIARAANYDYRHLNEIDKFLRHLRISQTTYILGARATTLALQPAGHANAIGLFRQHYKGIDWFGFYTDSIKTVLAGGNWTEMAKVYQDVRSKSDFMRDRPGFIDRDFRDAMLEASSPVPNWPGLGTEASVQAFKVGRQSIKASMLAIAYVQLFSVDLPTWLTAYNVAIEKLGLAEADAIDHADKMVSMSQASSQPMDANRVQSAYEAVKMFTLYSTYMMTVWNQLVSTGWDFNQGKATKVDVVAALMFFIAIPAVMATFVRSAVPGGTSQLPDPEDDNLFAWFAGVFLAELAGTIPFLRPLGGVAREALSSGGRFYPENVPFQQLVSQTRSLVREVVVDKDAVGALFDAARVAGMLTGLPISWPLSLAEKALED